MQLLLKVRQAPCGVGILLLGSLCVGVELLLKGFEGGGEGGVLCGGGLGQVMELLGEGGDVLGDGLGEGLVEVRCGGGVNVWGGQKGNGCGMCRLCAW